MGFPSENAFMYYIYTRFTASIWENDENTEEDEDDNDDDDE